MKILEGRRMAAVFAAYIGIFSAYVLIPSVREYVFVIGIVCFLLFALNLLLQKGKRFSVRKAIVLFLMLISVVAACMRSTAYAERTDVRAKHYADGEIYSAEGEITKILYEEAYGAAYEVLLFSLNGQETKLGLVLTMPQNGELSVGDTVLFQGEMKALSDTYEIYRKADGIFLRKRTSWK